MNNSYPCFDSGSSECRSPSPTLNCLPAKKRFKSDPFQDGPVKKSSNPFRPWDCENKSSPRSSNIPSGSSSSSPPTGSILNPSLSMIQYNPLFSAFHSLFRPPSVDQQKPSPEPDSEQPLDLVIHSKKKETEVVLESKPSNFAIRYVKLGNYRIFLSLRFYVKSKLVNSEYQNLQF